LYLKSIAFLTVLLCASTGVAQSPTIIRVPVRIVTVPAVVVSAEGRLIRGLEADNFRLLDNDRTQHLRLDYVDEPLSIAIVVQANDPVRAWLPQVRRVASTVEALLVGARGESSLNVFGADVKLIQPLTGSSAMLDKAFASITASAGNDSHTLDAVASAAKQLEQVSADRRRVILLIAQSGDTGSASSLRDVLRELELNNIAVYSLVTPRVGNDLVEKTISVTDAKSAFHTKDVGFVASVDLAKLIPEIYRAEKAAAGQDDLTVLTSEMGGRRIPFRKLSELESGISSIGEELYTEYVLSYTPDRYVPGYHRIVVQADRPDVVVRARPGYYVLESDVRE
jgi:VWFA-related protein